MNWQASVWLWFFIAFFLVLSDGFKQGKDFAEQEDYDWRPEKEDLIAIALLILWPFTLAMSIGVLIGNLSMFIYYRLPKGKK